MRSGFITDTLLPSTRKLCETLLPRVQHSDTHRLEVGPVSGHDDQPVYQGRRGDQRIPVGFRIGYMEQRAPPRDSSIYRQNALGKGRQHAFLDPLPDEPALAALTPREQERTGLQLENADAGKEQVGRRYAVGPFWDVGIGPVRPAEFGRDAGVEQEHHPSAASRRRSSPNRGGSKTISSLSGCTSKLRIPAP